MANLKQNLKDFPEDWVERMKLRLFALGVQLNHSEGHWLVPLQALQKGQIQQSNKKRGKKAFQGHEMVTFNSANQRGKGQHGETNEDLEEGYKVLVITCTDGTVAMQTFGAYVFASGEDLQSALEELESMMGDVVLREDRPQRVSEKDVKDVKVGWVRNCKVEGLEPPEAGAVVYF
eukprot:TRINITY_DN68182_c9_g6_i1.p1 TRINITY_DN68182_c9_g6~~TRINITY_DN68182_c9_g6_i1.p1  ORF type:complete len:176 (+),score=30.92 TRINITY_DN68182_c9_g6_i1:142-669(+)